MVFLKTCPHGLYSVLSFHQSRSFKAFFPESFVSEVAYNFIINIVKKNGGKG